MVIPDSVDSVGRSAFRDCRKLESVRIGNGVTYIGDYAFFGCTSLESLTIETNYLGLRRMMDYLLSSGERNLHEVKIQPS